MIALFKTSNGTFSPKKFELYINEMLQSLFPQSDDTINVLHIAKWVVGGGGYEMLWSSHRSQYSRIPQPARFIRYSKIECH